MLYYLFAILPNINNSIAIALGVGVIPLVMLTIGYVVFNNDYSQDEMKVIKSISKWFYPLYVVLIMLHTFIPSQKQVAFIIAAPYIVENQELKEVGNNTAEIVKLGTQYLKEVLNEKVNDKTQTDSM